MIEGKCVGCTTCCTELNVIYARSPELDEWIEARRVKPGRDRGLKIVQQNEQFVEVAFKEPCPQLKDGKCLIQDTKPKVCRDYPQNLENFWVRKGLDPNKSLGPKCGFRYKEEN